MGKKKKQQRICTNYAKSCPFANQCDNCKRRAIRKTPSGTEIVCKDRHDTHGDTSKCFVCANEGVRCKEEETGGRKRK